MNKPSENNKDKSSADYKWRQFVSTFEVNHCNSCNHDYKLHFPFPRLYKVPLTCTPNSYPQGRRKITEIFTFQIFGISKSKEFIMPENSFYTFTKSNHSVLKSRETKITHFFFSQESRLSLARREINRLGQLYHQQGSCDSTAFLVGHDLCIRAFR